MTDLERWHADAEDNGWLMPYAPWWKRLPVIRQIRSAYNGFRVDQHNRMWRHLGAVPQGYDSWVVFGIWHGKELDR